MYGWKLNSEETLSTEYKYREGFSVNGFKFKFKGMCINLSGPKGGGQKFAPTLFFDNFFENKLIKNPDIEKNSI